jgi:uncharacterized repeat protein (TIGR03803 family)
VYILRSSRVLINTLLIASLTACGGTSVPMQTPTLASAQSKVDAPKGHFRLLFTFYNPAGTEPDAGLVASGASFYGAAASGGRYDFGTIYQLSVTGEETVLHSFSGTDGEDPEGELLAAGGNLYGTTTNGGSSGDGVVYVATPSGTVNVLHSFSGDDGAHPSAGLVQVGQLLYGTTKSGGAHGDGTVFSVDTSGNEKVIYSFGTRSNDGMGPSSTLLFWKKKLYGTTRSGGAYSAGTVFAVTTAGKESIAYNLGSGNDGKDPYLSTLTPFDGRLYGTTALGGTHGQGVVFAIFPGGVARTIYNFGDHPTDGNSQVAGVIAYRNALYGTSYGGGAGGQGTIYRVTKSGGETVLYAFLGNDGGGSLSRLLGEGSNLYGTLSEDGSTHVGTAFRFTP